MFKSFSSLLVFTSKQHEITQICIANNRQTARGAMGCDTLNTKNTFSFNRYCIFFFFLASTPRILAMKSNVLDEHNVGNGGQIRISRARN